MSLYILTILGLPVSFRDGSPRVFDFSLGSITAPISCASAIRLEIVSAASSGSPFYFSEIPNVLKLSNPLWFSRCFDLYSASRSIFAFEDLHFFVNGFKKLLLSFCNDPLIRLDLAAEFLHDLENDVFYGILDDVITLVPCLSILDGTDF